MNFLFKILANKARAFSPDHVMKSCQILPELQLKVQHIYGIRRSLIVIGSITGVKQRRARFIIGWVTAW